MEALRLGLAALLLAGSCGAQTAFPFHTYHVAKLGRLDCNLCHVSVSRGSVELKRPGPEQCKLCHPAGSVEIPAVKPAGSLLIHFSHQAHVDPKSRVDRATGVRGDCAFCHQSSGEVAIPGHTQCAACHAKAGIQPELSPFLRTAGCRGCHNPEALEAGGSTARVRYRSIRFSHAAHKVNCATCHAGMPGSADLGDQPLPTMTACANCHLSSRLVPAAYRIANCAGCHLDTRQPDLLAASFNPNVRPPSHTEAFRLHHEGAASAGDAKCFACHQNVVPSAAAREQCNSCHLIMRPASHTARWKDDIHGKYAALDRQTCATCHTTDYCSRCHNELPNSHLPLPVFKNGGHATLAVLNRRSCFTCHTFQNTCAACHASALTPAARKP